MEKIGEGCRALTGPVRAPTAPAGDMDRRPASQGQGSIRPGPRWPSCEGTTTVLAAGSSEAQGLQLRGVGPRFLSVSEQARRASRQRQHWEWEHGQRQVGRDPRCWEGQVSIVRMGKLRCGKWQAWPQPPMVGGAALWGRGELSCVDLGGAGAPDLLRPPASGQDTQSRDREGCVPWPATGSAKAAPPWAAVLGACPPILGPDRKWVSAQLWPLAWGPGSAPGLQLGPGRQQGKGRPGQGKGRGTGRAGDSDCLCAGSGPGSGIRHPGCGRQG